MTELPSSTDDKQVTLPEEPRVKSWEKRPSLIVDEAIRALERQREKRPRLLSIAGFNGFLEEGIYILPRWEGRYAISHIGQRRGLRDLATRGRSAHNVSFCVAEFRDAEKKTIISSNIALKPFNEIAGAIKEITSTERVLQLGFKTITPFCVIADRQKSFVISPVRKDVVGVDEDRWEQFNSGVPGVREHLLLILAQVSRTVASLHSKGVNHSDVQLKNFWQKSDNSIEPFDWEAARFFQNPPQPDELLQMALDDLEDLFGTVTGLSKDFPLVIFAGPKQAKWLQFNQNIFSYYIDQLLFELGEAYLDTIVLIEPELKRVLNIPI